MSCKLISAIKRAFWLRNKTADEQHPIVAENSQKRETLYGSLYRVDSGKNLQDNFFLDSTPFFLHTELCLLLYQDICLSTIESNEKHVTASGAKQSPL